MNTTSPNRLSLRENLLQSRYLLRDATGHALETPDQMVWRVARTVAAVEKHYQGTESTVQQWAETFHRIMAKGQFLPNSPTLMNAGQAHGLLSACFVLPLNDSIEDIFQTVEQTALIQKAGGGTGFAFERLRPTGDRVSTTGGQTSGPVSFWKVIAETTNTIQQGAHRRGANMGMMDIRHPDILKFIHAKQDVAALNNFNVSVKIPDDFMHALDTHPEAPHVVTNPRTTEHYVIPKKVDRHTYAIQDLEPAGGSRSACHSVRDLWQMLVINAHATGEPGVCYIDRINQTNPTPHLGPIRATNPCGEQPLLDYEACTLGSLNVAKFVRPDGCDMDWHALGRAVHQAVRFLDNTIDANHWPIEESRAISLGNRKIGLGLMGFADALILLGMRYDSDRALAFADRLSEFLQSSAHRASADLARERGSFPYWQGSVWDTTEHTPMRHATCTTIAPTGSISIIAECSSGIEPVYGMAVKRVALNGAEFTHVHPLFEVLGTRQGWMTERVRERLLSGESVHAIKEIPRALTEVFTDAHQISPSWQVRVQAAFQAHTDNAVSKTVNLPPHATVQDVETIFKLAYALGSKGITVYRDRSRPGQVLSGIDRQ